MPVVLMTGHGDVASSVRGMKTGAVDYLVKPFERDVLLAAIDTWRWMRGRRRTTRTRGTHHLHIANAK
jgi:two-component system, LuxR family, response regulator FixJ